MDRRGPRWIFSAVDAYVTAASADNYPSADRFILLAPTDLGVYGPIAEAEKGFATTGKQLSAIAKVVGKAGVGGATLSTANIADYNLDASVSFISGCDSQCDREEDWPYAD